LRFRTALVEGMRVPVEPYLTCDLGHEHAISTPGHAAEPLRREDDLELIG
jgi:hypothetical protein